MGHGFKASALIAALGLLSQQADATAFLVEGYFDYLIEPYKYDYELDEAIYLGFVGRARVTYSARVTLQELADGTNTEYDYFLLEGASVQGFDSVNGGPWQPIESPPWDSLAVWLYQPYLLGCDDCEVIPDDPERDFLMPIGAFNWDGGQFQWVQNPIGWYARFDFEGGSYECDSDANEGCYGPDGFWREGKSWEAFGTYTLVPEPTSLALLGFGLAGLCLSRRQKAA